uniref:CID domain-containing protein n=1 Tax=Cucumis sativus TaxID=3659 RepID=A0A0A0LBI8_CUCSA
MILFIFDIKLALSKWCISHRKKAKQIVETWDKLFNSSQKEQRVSFLYLANDILQNSRRKGSEFVNEFWKVLPGALKYVYDHGDESGKKAVARLVCLLFTCAEKKMAINLHMFFPLEACQLTL